MTTISVIVPVYKVESYLDRCIESIVSQTYRELEIILVDDGSPDRCPHICDDWSKKDCRIKVIHKENGGLSDARNAGILAARGELIGFVDSDDWIAPEMYQRLQSALVSDQSDIAACAVEMIWEDRTQRNLLTVRENCLMNSQEAQQALLEETKLKQPVWYKLYRRRVLEGIFFEKGRMHEDVFWSYQVIGNAERVSLIDYIGYYYWQRSDSIMGERYSFKRLDVMEAYCLRYEYIHIFFPALEKEARRSILANCIYHGQMAMRYLSKKDRKKAFEYLNKVKRSYPIKVADLSDIKASHRMWFILGKYSLKTVCFVKNVLKVGF